MPDQRFVDLHTHSTASDGTDAPTELIRKAKALGLAAIALTDHDTTAGHAEAGAEADRLGMTFLTGIEISARYPARGVMHLLGYGIDASNATLQAMIGRLQESRQERNLFLIDALNDAGVRISMDEVAAAAGNTGVIGRPHFARVLTAKGHVPHPGAAYRYYLGNAGAFEFDRYEPEPKEAIAALHAAGGVVSLAHPVQLRKDNFAQLAQEIRKLADAGLDAVETLHSDHNGPLVKELQSIARRVGLLETGGSDYHGGTKRHISLGRVRGQRVPWRIYEALAGRLGRQ